MGTGLLNPGDHKGMDEAAMNDAAQSSPDKDASSPDKESAGKKKEKTSKSKKV